MNKNNKGFSLVELIVVIAIMAILAAVAVVSYSIYIDRAQDAADDEYLGNILYFSELFAIEHQLDLDWVEIAPVVDGPEDIRLICKNPDGSHYEYTKVDKEEIFEAVGPGTIEGGLNNGKYNPNQGGGDGGNNGENGDGQNPDGDDNGNNQNPGGDVGTVPCGHEHYEEVDNKPATCTEDGWILYECTDAECDQQWKEIVPAEHVFHQVKNTKYEVCEKCGMIRGGVIVDID